MAMDKRTVDALEASIRNWQEKISATNPDKISLSGSDCALCRLFNDKETCDGCPVATRTGQHFCNDTPYYKVRYALHAWRYRPESLDHLNSFRRLAQEEIDFLVSLREPEATS